MEKLNSRARGTMLGLAAGNMLGLPMEFKTSASATPVADIETKEISRPWDDDLAQAAFLAESLVAKRAVDIKDLALRLVHWARTNGRGMGRQTRDVISHLAKGFSPRDAARQVWERSNGYAAGNGAVMRCAPVALAFHDNPAALASAALESAALTHFDPRCTHSAVAVCAAVAALLHDQPPLDAAHAAVSSLPKPEPLVLDAIRAARTDSMATLPFRVDGEFGYTIHTTRIGLWAVEHASTLEATLMQVVAQGGDADTNGAVAGALLGAKFGEEAIPVRWLDRMRGRDDLGRLGEKLVDRARSAG